MSTRTITPDEALELTAPTDGFLCPLSANVYGIDFLEFEIKDYDSGESIFHVRVTSSLAGAWTRRSAVWPSKDSPAAPSRVSLLPARLSPRSASPRRLSPVPT